MLFPPLVAEVKEEFRAQGSVDCYLVRDHFPEEMRCFCSREGEETVEDVRCEMSEGARPGESDHQEPVVLCQRRSSEVHRGPRAAWLSLRNPGGTASRRERKSVAATRTAGWGVGCLPD